MHRGRSPDRSFNVFCNGRNMVTDFAVEKRGSVCNRTEHPSKGRLASPPWGRKNCKAKPRRFPQKWLNLHTLQVKQATNRHKTAKNLMKNMIQCRIKTDRDSGLKTPSDAMRRVPGGSPDQKHPTWERGVSPAIPNGPRLRQSCCSDFLFAVNSRRAASF